MTEPVKKILLVDDEPDLLDIYKTALVMEGLKVVTASNGAEALRMADSDEPDLILLDVMMPEVDGIADGFQVLERLKRDVKTRSIPVVMLTSLGQKGDQENAEKLGALSYLTKSNLKPQDVVEFVKRTLDQLS